MKSFSAFGSMPNFSRSSVRLPLSRIRSTIFSPKSVGSVETRKSITRFPMPQLDAAVLGEAPLGDVEVREDLEAGDQRRLHLGRRPHDLLEHAVDAVADADVLLVALEVDVGGAAGDGVVEDAVDQLDDRRLVDLRLERADADLLFLLEHLDIAP
jgi:hypothetical protein